MLNQMATPITAKKINKPAPIIFVTIKLIKSYRLTNCVLINHKVG
jgi:hypothetical protein